MRLGIGDELKRVALNPESPYKLAPVEEVLELHPELRSSGSHSSFLPLWQCRTSPRNLLAGVAKHCQQKKKHP
jgi:hypothetical protein